MAQSIGKLAAFLSLDTKGWTSGFASAGASAKSFLGSIVGKVGGAVAGIASVGAAVHSIASGMNQVDRQAKLADRLGITVGEVQKLSLAADLAGTDVEVLARGMLKMGKNIGSGGMSLDKRLFQVADSIAAIKDAGERAKRAEDIFGKGGLELINTLAQGSRGILTSAEAIDKFGLSLSRVQAAGIEALNDSLTETGTILRGLQNLLLAEIAPGVNDFLRTWLIGLESMKNSFDNLGVSAQSFVKTMMFGALPAIDNIIAGLAAGPGIGFGDAKSGLAAQRQDFNRNTANGGRLGGAALLGKTSLGGGVVKVGYASGGAERGTVEAGRLIQGARGNLFSDALKPTNDKLEKIARNTDSRRMPAPVARGRL